MTYLLCIITFYIAGIFFANFHIEKNISLFLYPAIIALIIGLIEYRYKSTKLFFTLFISCFSLIIGSSWYNLNKPKQLNNDLSYYAPIENIKLEGTVINEPKIDQNKISFELQPDLVTNPYIFLTNGKSIVNIYQNDLDINYGDKIEIEGNLDLPPNAYNPDEFSYRNYLEQQGIFSYIVADNINILERNTKKDFNSFIINIRKKLLSTLNNSMPKDAVNIIGSLVFGAKATPVSKDIRDNFTELGLAHVLAASGMQISLIMSAGLLIIRFSRFNKLVGICLIIVSILFYMAMTGLPPSILRAGLLNIIILLIQYKRETPDTYKLLFLVSFIILLFNPLILYDVGFQFSVLATFGLLYISKPLEDKLTFIPTPLASVISMIIAAQVMVLPLQIYHFGQFSFLFLISNLIAVLFINLLTYLSIITIFLGLIIPFIANITGSILYYILNIFLGIVSYLSDIPGSISYVKKPEIITVILFYVFIVFITEIIKNNVIKIDILKTPKFVAIISFKILLLISLIYISYTNQDNLLVSFINVKQGFRKKKNVKQNHNLCLM